MAKAGISSLGFFVCALNFSTGVPKLVPVVYDTGLVKRGLTISFDNGRLTVHG